MTPRRPCRSAAWRASWRIALLVLAGPALSRGADDWADAEAIVARIRAPEFPPRDYIVTDFGAHGDGRTDCRAAIAQAIARCSREGGGRVVLPAGLWLTNGPVHLKSRVNLYLAEGAVLRFGNDPKDYLPPVLTRWEGTECFNYSPLIYAYQAEDVAVTGAGIIDGNARDSWATWPPRQRPDVEALRRMGAESVAVHERVFGAGHWLRPAMLQFFACRRVLVEGVTIRDAPFWTIHPVYCSEVIVRRVTVDSLNRNNDGVDPDSSTDVLIEDCVFRTGDDAVAIKSGRDQDAWRVGRPTVNVVVRRCVMDSKQNGLCIGSEMSGGVRNVFVEKCRIGETAVALYFKGNLDRGGTVERVRVREVSIQRAREAAIRFSARYPGGYRGGSSPPRFADFVIEKVTCATAEKAGFSVIAVPEEPVRDVTLRDVTIRRAARPAEVLHAEKLILERVSVNGVDLRTADLAAAPATTR